MSPNSSATYGSNSAVNSCNFMKMSKTSKASTYVPIDRLYDIARQLAQLELTGDKLVDRCVSLLDTSCDHNVLYNSSVNPVSNDKNYCEVVSVPTSTHVAQIVGKQGSKIKLLRAKSRTYIQTPVNGEEPVFIITGRREDVLKVKAEILSASEHFTAISEDRMRKLKQNSDIPGGIKLNLITPVFLIGLIVGRSGNTIRKLQETTKTYIETPKMLENSAYAAFSISGQRVNVDSVIQQITDHVKSKNPDRRFSAVSLPNGDIKLDLID